MGWRFPNEVIPILQISYVTPCDIHAHKLDESAVLRSME